MIPLEITIDRAGTSPLRLTAHQRSLRFSTAAVGGFASCSFDMPGDPGKWKREIPKLSVVRIVLDTFVIWEGQVEDHGMRLGGDEIGCTVQCYGPQRRLDEVSVRQIWLKRDMQWHDRSFLTASPNAWAFGSGNIEPADFTRAGIRYQGTGNGPAVANGVGHNASAIYEGVTLTRFMATNNITGDTAKIRGEVYSTIDGASGVLETSFTVGGTIDEALQTGATEVIIGAAVYAGGPYTPVSGDVVQFENIRLLGTTVREDVDGGVYGGKILRDLIPRVPGLSIGIIDTGDDFAIQSIERAVRASSRSVVEEVAGYYTREWGVWEDGRFDWKAVNRDEPQWITTIADLLSGSELTSTVDSTSKTVYVLYTNAADQRDKEASASATLQANPWVKQSRTKDVLLSPGFQMTTATSAQLASRLSNDFGSYPAVQGRLVLSAMKSVKRANGSPLPAFQIRAGENIIVPNLPKSELFTSGRDGETLFHIVSTEADLDNGLMTLEVEGQDRARDALLARLAAATRTVTGG